MPLKYYVCSANRRIENKYNSFAQISTKGGYDTNNSSHIIPFTHCDEKTALGFSKRLLKDGVYAQAVRYPTVEKNSARIRLSVTASMTLRQIHTISDAIESAGRFFKII